MTLHLDVALQMQHDHASDLRRTMGRRPSAPAATEQTAPRVRFVRNNATRVVSASPGHPVGCVA